MDIGTPSTKLNKYPHRNKAKGFTKPANKDNRQTRPPAKDQPKKYKCYGCGSTDHLLNKCPKRKNISRNFPRKTRNES